MSRGCLEARHGYDGRAVRHGNDVNGRARTAYDQQPDFYRRSSIHTALPSVLRVRTPLGRGAQH